MREMFRLLRTAVGFLVVLFLSAGNAHAVRSLSLTPSAATNLSESSKMISKGFVAALGFDGFGISARVVDYHVILTNSVLSPLLPEGRLDYVYHFIRSQVGLTVDIAKRTGFYANFGRDSLDSKAYVTDGGLSQWLWSALIIL